ncbi:MAG: alpha/beta fold hydrolase [Planctomycetota bacterium]
MAGLSLLLGGWVWFALPPPVSGADEVVLLHGLGRSASTMRILEWRLRTAGFRVLNIDYDSLQEDFDEVVGKVARRVDELASPVARRHYVGHSLGGLVARAVIDKRPPMYLGRVVMMGTPNDGSPVADMLREKGLAWVLGRSGQQIGVALDLPPPDYEVGVLAGEEDPLVPPERTRLPGMTDFMLVPGGHVRMRYDATSAEQVIHFLRTGRFKR